MKIYVPYIITLKHYLLSSTKIKQRKQSSWNNSKSIPDFYTGTIYSIEYMQSFKKNFICNWFSPDKHIQLHTTDKFSKKIVLHCR